MSLTIMGMRTSKNGIDWATIRGPNRASSALVEFDSISLPPGSREEGLAWVRDEIIELVAQQTPDLVSMRPAEGRALSVAVLERSQIDGILLGTLAALEVPCKAKKSATIRSGFGVRNNRELDAELNGLPALRDVPQSAARRDPIVAALAALGD